MKTTIDIPQEELEEAIRWTGARTKREAVVTAVVDFNRRQRLEQLAGELGSFAKVISPAELKKLRESK
ncbi:MAG: type II toxin-antitoxin system VapB family antitoxin [Acidobacteriota bacterium]|nr:type II toxin-antitoxin system VapB family antitoxin [Acidobacteriota bacterium]